MSDSHNAFPRIAILGAGAWGTALALATHMAGRQTTLWVREDDVLADIRAGRGNRFLPEAALPKDMAVTGDLNEAAAADACCWWCRRRCCTVLPIACGPCSSRDSRW